MKKTINQTHIEGLIYQHDLKVKITGDNSQNPGTEYITGVLEIATDDAHTNIVPVHFTYVTAVTSKKTPNETFKILKNIIDGVHPTIMNGGVENAAMVRIDSALGLNEFYTDRNGEEILVSAKRNEGGFIHLVNKLAEDENNRNTFKCDIIIKNAHRIEGDPDKNTNDKVIVDGYIFNFRGEILPVSFSAVNEAAMDYFESLGATPNEPIFTQIWGRQISENIIQKKVEESAFGPAQVTETQFTRKDFVITGAKTEVYDWDSEETILVQELTDILAKREVTLATLRKNREDYLANKNNPAPATAAKGTFKF